MERLRHRMENDFADVSTLKKEYKDGLLVITIEGNYLTVSAVRKMKNEVKEKDYYRCESSFL